MEVRDLPVSTVTKDELKVALLENNERMYEKINASIEHSAEKITKAVNDRTDPFLAEMTRFADGQATMRAEVDALNAKVGSLWAKMIAVGTACATIGGFLGILIESLIIRR